MKAYLSGAFCWIFFQLLWMHFTPSDATIAGLQTNTYTGTVFDLHHYDNVTNTLFAADATGSFVWALDPYTFANKSSKIYRSAGSKAVRLVAFEAIGRVLLICDDCSQGNLGSYSCDTINMDTLVVQFVPDDTNYHLQMQCNSVNSNFNEVYIQNYYMKILYTPAGTPMLVRVYLDYYPISSGVFISKIKLRAYDATKLAPNGTVSRFTTDFEVADVYNSSAYTYIGNICGNGHSDDGVGTNFFYPGSIQYVNNFGVCDSGNPCPEVYNIDISGTYMRVWCQKYSPNGYSAYDQAWNLFVISGVGASTTFTGDTDNYALIITTNTHLTPNVTESFNFLPGFNYILSVGGVFKNGDLLPSSSYSYWLWERVITSSRGLTSPAVNGTSIVFRINTTDPWFGFPPSTSSFPLMPQIPISDAFFFENSVKFDVGAIDTYSFNSTYIIFSVDTTGVIHKYRFTPNAANFTLTEFDTALDRSTGLSVSHTFLIPGTNSLYGFANDVVLSVPTYNCSIYTDCFSCAGANNPHCGWCILENSCTISSQCPESTWAHGYPASVSGCPTLVSVGSNGIYVNGSKYFYAQGDNTSTITLITTNLPYVTTLSPSSYTCRFEGTNFTANVAAKFSSNTINCNVNAPSSPLTDGIIEPFSMYLVYNNTVLFSVPVNLTAFDCSYGNPNCTECVSYSSQYPCGWCTLQTQCTPNKTKCIVPLGSLPYTVCPYVKSLSPIQVPVATSITVYIELLNTPPPGTGNFFMVFNRINNKTHVQPLTFIQQISQYIELNGNTPLFSNQTLSNGLTEPVVASVVYNNTQMGNVTTTIIPFSIDFTWFDCTKQGDTCYSCLNSTFPCGWLYSGWYCDYDNPSSSYGYTNSTSMCPAITNATGYASDGTTIFVPVDQKNLTVYDMSIQSQFLPSLTTGNSYKCFFSGLQNNDTYNTTAVRQSSSTMTCPVPDVTVTNSTTGVSAESYDITVKTDLASHNTYYILPETSPLLPVRFFNCSVFEHCSTCLNQGHAGSVLQKVNGCVWCVYTSYLAACTFTNNCVQNHRTYTCPLPNITSISPVDGIMAGGTKITITGTALGYSPLDITGVEVAGVPCGNIIWVNMARVLCTTAPFYSQNSSTVGPVVIYFDFGQTAVSSQNYSYLPNPTITDVYPLKGIKTHTVPFTINGTGFNLVNVVSIFIGVSACDYIAVSSSIITMSCYLNTTNTTAPASFPVTINMGTFVLNSTQLFTVYPIPEITGFSPKEAMLNSYLEVNITGTNMNAATYLEIRAGAVVLVVFK